MSDLAALPLLRRRPSCDTFLALGETPLADALVARSSWTSPRAAFPLDVAFCPCSLVQILEEVPPEQLFVDNYLYFSSFSDDLLRHSRAHALELIETPGPRTRAASSSSWPATTATCCRTSSSAGIPVLGIDPGARPGATRPRRPASRRCAEFFGAELAPPASAPSAAPADVIIANNVMAHVPDLNGFVEGMRDRCSPTTASSRSRTPTSAT